MVHETRVLLVGGKDLSEWKRRKLMASVDGNSPSSSMATTIIGSKSQSPIIEFSCLGCTFEAEGPGRGAQALSKGEGVFAFALLPFVALLIGGDVVGCRGSLIPEHTEEDGCRFHARNTTRSNSNGTTNSSDLDLWSSSPLNNCITSPLNNCVSALKASKTNNHVQRPLELEHQ